MIPPQTSQVLWGLAVALLYAGAVRGIGVSALELGMGPRAAADVRARIGALGFEWIGFVLGQGILGLAWLALALAGILNAWLVVGLCALGWGAAAVTTRAFPSRAMSALREIWSVLSYVRPGQSWYWWAGMGIAAVALLRGLRALWPTNTDDALWVYLVQARAIAFDHRLALQPFVPPNFALLPLQVEIHWAALFSVANETAVFVWDYLCAVSLMSGVGVLAWALTSSRRVALLAVLMVLSTPAVLEMMGAAKTDNAAAQFGIAAFLGLALWPALGYRAMILAGLCAGWALGSRYTNVIILPALIVFARTAVHHAGKEGRPLPGSWIRGVLLACVFAGLAGAPMLIKNWLLVGCPLAPQFGCRDTFWADAYAHAHADRQNISVGDFLLYPLVWTFAHRVDMLGNISPLFVGFLPFLLASRRSSFVRPALSIGLAGLVALGTWWLLKPLILYTRWLLVPLGLLTVPLSAAVVAAERERPPGRFTRLLVGGAVLLLVGFLLFQSRGAVYGVRYAASLESRAARYAARPGYDVGAWLEAHVGPGRRVAFGGWSGYGYFASPRHLSTSESTAELQWLWQKYGRVAPSTWTADWWRFYAGNGFTHVVVEKPVLDEAVRVWPDDIARARPRVVFVGREDAVLSIERPAESR